MKLYEKRDCDIRRWFKEHEATIFHYKCDSTDAECAGEMERLIWRKPRSSAYLVDYVVRGSRLFVTGDLGSAVYCWSQSVSFAWIANCDLQYFAGKCEASEEGRQFKEWEQSECEAYLNERIEQWWQSEFRDGYEEPEAKRWQDLSEDEKEEARDKYAERLGYDGFGELVGIVCESEHEWNGFCYEHDDEFGTDCMGAGNVVALRCQSHLAGLKMAVEQLAKGSCVPVTLRAEGK